MTITVETTKIILDRLKTIVPTAVCRRSYFPVADMEELESAGKPVILIVPVERVAECITRGGTIQNKFAIDIAVNAKLQHINDEPETLLEEIDALIEIVETIYNFFLKKIVTETESENFRVVCDKPEHLIFSDMEMIQQYNCFLSVIRLNSQGTLGTKGT